MIEIRAFRQPDSNIDLPICTGLAIFFHHRSAAMCGVSAISAIASKKAARVTDKPIQSPQLGAVLNRTCMGNSANTTAFDI